MESSALTVLILPTVRGFLGGFAINLAILGLMTAFEVLIGLWPRPVFPRAAVGTGPLPRWETDARGRRRFDPCQANSRPHARKVLRNN